MRMIQLPKETGLRLGAICLLALALRLAVLLVLDGGLHSGDAYEYLGIANSLVTGQGYALGKEWWDGGSAFDDPVTTAWRVPGYPLLVAAIQLAAGARVVPAVKVVQALLGAASCLLAFYAARAAFGTRAGMYAATGLAVYPPLLYYTRDVGSETLFAALILGALALGFSGRGRTSIAGAASLGGLVGVACLVRPMGAMLLPALLLDRVLRRRACRLWLAHVGLMILGFGVVVTPWMVRNARLPGGKPALASMTYTTLWLTIHRSVAPEGPRRSATQRNIDLLARQGDHVHLSDMSEWERERYFRSAWLRYAGEHLGTYVRIVGGNTWHFWKPAPSAGYYAAGVRIAGGLCSLLLYALAITGARSGHGQKGAVCVLVVYLALIALAHVAFYSVMRHRVAEIDAVLILLAGQGAAWYAGRLGVEGWDVRRGKQATASGDEARSRGR